jgi:hypothetical protein
MIFASTLRTVRRPRRIPSVASLVRVLGTVRVSDQPLAWSTGSGRADLVPSHGGARRAGPSYPVSAERRS